ncbi:MAG: hypothetical protein Q9213_008378 [Squamulea squamosa]
MKSYHPDSFSDNEKFAHGLYHSATEVSEGCGHAFFTIEAKTHGEHAEGLNEMCTAGTALVQAHRKLRELAGVLRPEHHKEKIYVHWARVEGKAVTYRMHLVDSFGIGVEKHLKNCRKAVNNILDWGLLERQNNIKTLLNKIYSNYEKDGKFPEAEPDDEEDDGSTPVQKKLKVG